MNRSLVITHAWLVVEDEVLANGAVLIHDGRIAAIEASEGVGRGDGLPVMDAQGAYVIPGIIDTHNDSVESEINPRPLANLPRSFALANFERRALAAGVTTVFHAVSFADLPSKDRSLGGAVATSETIRQARTATIDHHVLHRCDVWSPESLDSLFDSLRRSRVRALSLNDHTPGQGQFRDLEKYKEQMLAYRRDDPSYDPDGEIAHRLRRKTRERETVDYVLARVQEEVRTTPATLVSHDDDTTEKVDRMAELGTTVAEFPITWEAARRAREHGMWITVGAPNIVRGGSNNGNLSAAELTGERLADIICADYHTPSLLFAAFKLVAVGVCDLARAIAMLTANPARAFGLSDRGVIAPGMIADLCVVRLGDGIPDVTAVLRSGVCVFLAGRAAERPTIVRVHVG